MPSQTLSQQHATLMPYEGAGIILLDSDNNVLIVQDKRGGKWSFPKGAPECYDYGRPLLTAKRECEEEIGLKADDDYELLADQPAFVHFNRHFFLARIKAGAESRIKLQETEIATYAWLNPRKSCTFWADLNSGVRSYMKREMVLSRKIVTSITPFDEDPVAVIVF